MKKSVGSEVGRFLNKLGFHQTTRAEYVKVARLEKQKREVEVWSPYAQKQKRVISRDTLMGTGLGFAVGGLFAGLPGMMVGATAGTYAGNVVGRRQAGKPRLARFVKPKQDLLRRLTLQEKRLSKK